MALLDTVHELRWTCQLQEDGYTCWTFGDSRGRRWGYVINAAAAGWQAHVGSFGQSTLPAAVPDRVETVATAAAGRILVEELADLWRHRHRTPDESGTAVEPGR